jgi:hypothetical protein
LIKNVVPMMEVAATSKKLLEQACDIIRIKQYSRYRKIKLPYPQ